MGQIAWGLLAEEPVADEGLSAGTVVLVVVAFIVVLAIVVWWARSVRNRRQAVVAKVVAAPRAETSAPPPSAAAQPTPAPLNEVSLGADAQRPAAPTSPVGVFISYRRNDAPHVAGRLFDRLREHFGAERIFMDVDSIEPGLDFGLVISEAVQSCKVMLVIIGPDWLGSRDQGGRRIDSADDYVRIELEQALSGGVRVIPVLVDGAMMPESTVLPEDVKSLARRNAVEITHRAFNSDADRLVELLDRILSDAASP